MLIMNETKPPKKHTLSYSETKERVDEMCHGYSLTKVLDAVSLSGNYQFNEYENY